jgi:hypothetical protein
LLKDEFGHLIVNQGKQENPDRMNKEEDDITE